MKILIADDEYLYRELLAGIVAQRPDDQATTVEDGLAAWQLLDDPRRFFDVVFLDIKMPGLDGLEVLRRVRSSPMLQNTAIIICTSHKDLGTISKAIQLGAKHFIIKPYTEVAIAQKLRQIGLAIAQASASGPIRAF